MAFDAVAQKVGFFFFSNEWSSFIYIFILYIIHSIYIYQVTTLLLKIVQESTMLLVRNDLGDEQKVILQVSLRNIIN